MLNLEIVVGALFRATWQGGLLSIVVGLVVRAVPRLPANVRSWLWLVVLVRLLAPAVPPSPASVFNLARLWVSTQSASSEEEHAEIPTAITPGIEPASAPPIKAEVVSTRQVTGHVQETSTSRFVFLAAILWGVGFVIVSGRMILALGTLRRLVARCRTSTDASATALLDECRLEAGVGPVPLLVAEGDITPGLAGIVWPRILISEQTLASLRRDELRWLCRHELAHARRRDLLVQRFWQLVCAIHWFNPLAWWAASRARLAAELGCDELLLRRTLPADRDRYAESLLNMAELLSGARAVSGTAGLLVREPALTTRIRAITDYSGRSVRAMAGGVALVATLALVGLTDASAQGPEKIEPAQPSAPKTQIKIDPKDLATTHGKMRVLVLDGDGRPVEGVDVFANVVHPGDGRWRVTNHTYFTNKAGIAVVELPPKVGITKVWASKKGDPGYPDLFACWFPGVQSDANELPAEFSFQPPLTPIGGTVKDEQGKTLRGVTVEVAVMSLGDPGLIGRPGQRPVFDEESYRSSNNPGRPVDAVTNAKGRWVIDHVPSAASIDLKLSCPGFVTQEFWNGAFGTFPRQARTPKIDMQTLRDQTATVVMRRSAPEHWPAPERTGQRPSPKELLSPKTNAPKPGSDLLPPPEGSAKPGSNQSKDDGRPVRIDFLGPYLVETELQRALMRNDCDVCVLLNATTQSGVRATDVDLEDLRPKLQRLAPANRQMLFRIFEARPTESDLQEARLPRENERGISMRPVQRKCRALTQQLGFAVQIRVRRLGNRQLT